jgi:aspartyl aminopeptidase
MEELLTQLSGMPTSSFYIAHARGRLLSAGFEELRDAEDWRTDLPDRFFATFGDSSIVAIVQTDARSGLFVQASSQLPSLRIEPGGIVRAGCEQARVRAAGDGVWWSWVDRDLTVAGRAILNDGTSLNVFIPETVAVIPSLSIHQSPGSGVRPRFVMPDHFFPIFSLGGDSTLPKLIAKVARCAEGDIAGYDVGLVPAEPSALVGLDGEFLATYPGGLIAPLLGLEEIAAAAKPKSGMIGLVVSGAPDILTKVLSRIGCSPPFASRSFLLRSENVAAGKAAPAGSGCYYEAGVSSLRTSDVVAVHRFVRAMEVGGVRLAKVKAVATAPAPLTAMPAADVGVPVMGLRSIREVISCDDIRELQKLIHVFFAQSQLLCAVKPFSARKSAVRAAHGWVK